MSAPTSSRTPRATPRTVLVTGGNRGIGLATARALAAQGHRVAVTHRGPARRRRVCSPVRCDVTSHRAGGRGVHAPWRPSLGPVEAVVSNAGVTDDTLLLRMSEDSLRLGARREPHRGLPGRQAGEPRRCSRRGCGRLVFVGSVVGLLRSRRAGQLRAPARPGWSGLARSLARELGSRGITSNVLAPGYVDTDMTAGLPQARRSEITSAVPLGRTASAEEIAGVVAFLVGEASSYVTGAVLPVDGGLGMGH